MEHLTRETFKAKVFDYATNKEWKFIGERPAIIDFYADWCGPCRMVAPILEQLSTEYAGQIDIYKIDTDKEPELAKLFNVMSIPAILFIPKGDKPQMSVGALSKESFEKAIVDLLKAGNPKTS